MQALHLSTPRALRHSQPHAHHELAGKLQQCVQPAWHGALRRRVLLASNPYAIGNSFGPSMNSDDDTNENSIKPGQHVFTFKRWDVHRNSKERYFRHLAGMFSSVTFINLLPPITGVTTAALLHGCYQTFLVPKGLPTLELNDGPMQLTSFALALLMVFRTDSSYSRWIEAMCVWNQVRNSIKDFVRSAACWVKDPALLSVLVRWTLAYAQSLKVYLREKGDICAATSRILLKHEHTQFCNLCKDTSTAYPQYALHVLQQAVTKAGLPANREDKLLACISMLSSCIGNAEKLLRYPIPLSYTRHTSRFMVIWLLALPISLWDDCGFMDVPITAMVSYLLLGIEEIGVQIEEPFSKLPVRDIVKDLERDVLYITASRKEVTELLDVSLSLTHAESLDAVAEVMRHNYKIGVDGEALPLNGNYASPLSTLGSSSEDDDLDEQRGRAAASTMVAGTGTQPGMLETEMSDCDEQSNEGVLFETSNDCPPKLVTELVTVDQTTEKARAA